MTGERNDLAGIGVIGVGGMGSRHARNISRHTKGAYLAGVYDPDKEKADKFSSECTVFDSPLELISNDSVDALIVASPDVTHIDFTLRCLESRKPVLCEKPLAITAEEVLPVIKAEIELGSPLVTVGFMRRFDPPHTQLKKVLEEERVGNPQLYKGIHRNRYAPPASEEEHFITQAAVHDIDAARWLLKSEVTTVYVRGIRVDRSLEEGTEDTFLITLSLANDTLAAVEVALSARYGYEVTAEVLGTSGSVKTQVPGNTAVRSENSRSAGVDDDWLERFREAYLVEVQHWIDHLGSGFIEEPGADAWDGYIGLLVADACIESLYSGEPVPVDCPEKPDIYKK